MELRAVPLPGRVEAGGLWRSGFPLVLCFPRVCLRSGEAPRPCGTGSYSFSFLLVLVNFNLHAT